MKHIYSSVTLDRRSNVDFETQIANELRNKVMLNKLDPKLLNVSYLASVLNIDEKTVKNGFNKLVDSEVLSFDKKQKHILLIIRNIQLLKIIKRSLIMI